MKEAISGPMFDMIAEVRRQETSVEQLQELMETGLFADLLKAKAKAIDRNAFRQLVGLKPLDAPKLELLLDPVSATVLLATTDRFIARDKFVVNTKNNAPVKISGLGSNFKEWLLDKIEEPKPASTLRPYLLKRSSVDGPIIAELGGEAKSETTLAEIYEIMEMQRNGEDGMMLNDGCANIFYVRDKRSVLRAVSVCWRDVGWYVYARSVESSLEWFGGRHVLSRNS